MRRRMLLHFLLALAVYSVCPPFTSYDAFWTVPTALSILAQGNTDVDEYMAAMPPPAAYAVECVPAGRTAISFARARGVCPGGHWYNLFPLAVSIVALPMILLMQGATRLFAAVGLSFSWLAAHLPPSSAHPFAAFLSGDLYAARPLVELWSAAPMAALAVALEYRIASRYLAPMPASLLTLLFAFGTPVWSTASRSLLQHAPSLVLLTAALYLVLRAMERPRLIQLAALPLALAFAVRPANVVSVALLTLYVAVHYRGYLSRYLLWSATVAVPFLGYNLAARHALLPQYFLSGPMLRPDDIFAGALVQLISPSRGILIFCPVFALSVLGIALAWRRRWLFPLTPYLVAILLLHTALVSLWWPGHCYGSRYFTDMTPLLALFLIPVIDAMQGLRGLRRTAAVSAFAALAVWGVFVHARGATSVAAHRWSVTPVDVDRQRSRVWDWRDPQFLRGLL